MAVGHIEDVELGLLLTGMADLYGYDFRQYARSSLLRRMRAVLAGEGLNTMSALQDRVLRDPACMARVVETISVHTTSMFRDADFYLSLRREVIPLLRTYPFVRIWVAGCSTGEEVYSLGIVLEEEGLYDRCRIYATDISDAVLARAARAVVRLPFIKDYTRAYVQAGGRLDFSRYYTTDDQMALLRSSLLRNVVFAQHNLTCDGIFNEFQLILCRNVLIYFGPDLRQRAHELFHSSLSKFGILGVGKKESLRFTPLESSYVELVEGTRLYRRLQ